MWEMIEPTWLSVLVLFALLCPFIAPSVLVASLPLKIAPLGAIPPTFRNTDLNQEISQQSASHDMTHHKSI